MKLQNSSFKNEAEAGAASRLVSTEKIYVTANGLNKTLEEAIVALDLGGASVSPIITNSALNSYDMASTLSNTLIRHTANSGVMYQLPTAVAGKKFFFINEGTIPTGGTVITVDSTNNKIDFNRGGNNFTATLVSATYNHGPSGVGGTLGTQIKTQMDAADGSATYTVDFNETEKNYKVTGSATFFFKFLTGTNVANTSRKLIGYLGLDGSAALVQVGMSMHNDVKIQSNTGDQIAFKNNLAITPGYLSLRKRGVMVAVTAIDATTWEVEQVTSNTHLKGSTIGDLREMNIVGRDTLVTKAVLPTAKYGAFGFSLNGYGYACNGFAGANTNEVVQYNDAANTWATKATGGIARSEGASFAMNGYGYICDGSTGSAVSNVDQYNDSANTWAAKAAGGTARNTMTGFSLNGFGYICNGALSNEVNQYNDGTNVWTTKATGGTARYGLAGFMLNGYGYICNGNTGSITNEVNQYNDSANTWTTKATGGSVRTLIIGFSSNGYGLIGYGTTGSNTNQVTQYNDSTNAWFNKATGGTARNTASSFSLNGFGYATGGSTGSNSNEVNQYN